MLVSIPALTWLQWSEATLQLPVNITQFAISGIHTSVISKNEIIPVVCEASLMHKLYEIGGKTKLCGTHACTFLSADILP
jgi:hypothetical protein